MKVTRTENQIVKTQEMSEKKNYQMKNFSLDKVEELETAIAPGGFGFGCGCKGIFGAFCG